MHWSKWKEHLTPEQWDAYVYGLLESNQDELMVTKDGKPYFYAGPPESAQSMPLLAWHDELKGWAEPVEWNHEQ